MRTFITDLAQWKRSKDGAPIFTCTEEAFFYAQLIYRRDAERLKISHLRRDTLFKLRTMRTGTSPNYQRMLDLAVKAQFYRECLEELSRIEKEEA